MPLSAAVAALENARHWLNAARYLHACRDQVGYVRCLAEFQKATREACRAAHPARVGIEEGLMAWREKQG